MKNMIKDTVARLKALHRDIELGARSDKIHKEVLPELCEAVLALALAVEKLIPAIDEQLKQKKTRISK